MSAAKQPEIPPHPMATRPEAEYVAQGMLMGMVYSGAHHVFKTPGNWEEPVLPDRTRWYDAETMAELSVDQVLNRWSGKIYPTPPFEQGNAE